MSADLVDERSKMMGVRKSFLAIALATIGLSLSPDAARAIGLSTISSETDLKVLLSQPAFIAEGQFDSISLKNDDNSESKADLVWSNGEQQPFSLSYDGSTVKYTVGDKTLETKNEGFFNDIFIYTKASEYSTSVVLKNLLLTDSDTTLSISGIAASYPNNTLNIWGIHDITESFTLIGNATLSGMNNLQNPANLTYQIQVGNVDSPQTSPDVNQGEAEQVDSPKPAPDNGTNTGIDWLSWLPKPGSGDSCISP